MLSILKTNIKIAVFTGAALLLLSSFGSAAHPRVLYKGIVSTYKLNIREKPARSSSVVVVVERGETIDVLEKPGDIGGWLRVMYKQDSGFIRNRPEYIELTPVPLPKKTIKLIKRKKIKSKRKEPVTKEPGIKTGKEKKQDILEKIQTQEKMVKTFSKKEVEILEELNEVDFALNKTRNKATALSLEIMQLEGKIGKLDQEKRKLAEEIGQNRRYAGKRLNALYKMNYIGRLDAVGLPQSVFEFILQQNSMKRIIQSDFLLIENQDLDLQKFISLELALQEEIQAKTVLETQLNGQIRMNKQEAQKKEMILKQIREKKKLSLAAVESLKHAALKLDQQISAMQKKEEVFSSGASFSSYQGRLRFPVKGKIISKYGPTRTGDYKSFTFQKGIDIRVQRGNPVKSVFKGEIIFAQWLKGYGNVLIVNHGEHYYTLYAHVEEVLKQKGEKVETGEVIATAGDTGSIKGLCLHFEIRHYGKPVNPMKWLKKGA